MDKHNSWDMGVPPDITAYGMYCPDSVFWCPQCPRYFMSEKCTKDHIAQIHNTSSDPFKIRTDFCEFWQCKMCNIDKFGSKILLWKHLYCEHGIRLSSNPDMSYPFSTWERLSHERQGSLHEQYKPKDHNVRSIHVSESYSQGLEGSIQKPHKHRNPNANPSHASGELSHRPQSSQHRESKEDRHKDYNVRRRHVSERHSHGHEGSLQRPYKHRKPKDYNANPRHDSKGLFRRPQSSQYRETKDYQCKDHDVSPRRVSEICSHGPRRSLQKPREPYKQTNHNTRPQHVSEGFPYRPQSSHERQTEDDQDQNIRPTQVLVSHSPDGLEVPQSSETRRVEAISEHQLQITLKIPESGGAHEYIADINLEQNNKQEVSLNKTENEIVEVKVEKIEPKFEVVEIQEEDTKENINKIKPAEIVDTAVLSRNSGSSKSKKRQLDCDKPSSVSKKVKFGKDYTQSQRKQEAETKKSLEQASMEYWQERRKQLNNGFEIDVEECESSQQKATEKEEQSNNETSDSSDYFKICKGAQKYKKSHKFSWKWTSKQ